MAEPEFSLINDDFVARIGGIAEVRRLVTQLTELTPRPEYLSYDFSRIKIGDQFYDDGQCRFKFELNRKGDGVLKIFDWLGDFEASVAVQGRKIVQDRILFYFYDENDHRVCSVRQMVKGKLQGLMFDFDEDDGNSLLHICIFDHKGFSLVPWVYFEPDGSMYQNAAACNYDQGYKFQLKRKFAQRLIKSDPENAVLQHYLQRLVQDHGGSELDYLTADNKLKPEFRPKFYDLFAHDLNQYSREVHPELEAQFLEFCAGEKERRAQGIVTTYDMALAALPLISKLK